jgi:DNA-binding GntR family transcriptional regulator
MTFIETLPVGRTLTEAIAGELREDIIAGKLRPGGKLWQDKLAERFDVSRIPIREALRQLAAEGLVVLHSHRSAVVAELTPEETAELLAIGGTLETLASRQGAERLGVDELEAMRETLEAMKRVETTPPEWYALNVRFHMIITRASGWNRLVKLVEETRRNVMRYIIDPELHRAHVVHWHAQHVSIYEACMSHDVESVRALLEHHWRYSSNAMLGHMRSEKRPAKIADTV